MQAALEKEKSSGGKETAQIQGQISELKVALESANKNMESQRALNRENEVSCKQLGVPIKK